MISLRRCTGTASRTLITIQSGSSLRGDATKWSSRKNSWITLCTSWGQSPSQQCRVAEWGHPPIPSGWLWGCQMGWNREELQESPGHPPGNSEDPWSERGVWLHHRGGEGTPTKQIRTSSHGDGLWRRDHCKPERWRRPSGMSKGLLGGAGPGRRGAEARRQPSEEISSTATMEPGICLHHNTSGGPFY